MRKTFTINAICDTICEFTNNSQISSFKKYVTKSGGNKGKILICDLVAAVLLAVELTASYGNYGFQSDHADPAGVHQFLSEA